MIEVFLIVMACASPDFNYCQRMLVIERPDPITCQLDRLPVGGVWQVDMRKRGNSNWSIFTYCEIEYPKESE